MTNQNTNDWEKEFDEKFVGDGAKDFIRSLLTKEREEIVKIIKSKRVDKLDHSDPTDWGDEYQASHARDVAKYNMAVDDILKEIEKI